MLVSFRRATAILVCTTVSMLVASCGGDSSSASPTSVVSTPATPSRPSADPRLPEGTYQTGTISLDRLIATGVAARDSTPRRSRISTESTRGSP